jgi:hypothetical protein
MNDYMKEAAMTAFRDRMKKEQTTWRSTALSHVIGHGLWNHKPYAHILPSPGGGQRGNQENLWPGIRVGGRFPLETYLSFDRNGNERKPKIQAHIGRDILISSWTLAANLYFPFGHDADGLRLIGTFLQKAVSPSIASVTAVELEWEHRDAQFKPPELLGEKDGGPGANQTSPDVAFEVVLEDGRTGIVLTEVKFTEHNFYPCSARKLMKPSNDPNLAYCHDLRGLQPDPQRRCGQHTVKGRRYWDHLAGVFDWNAPLRWCPAATAGYQLFRQQALAEGLATKSDLGLVVSSLAYHSENTKLVSCLRRTGRTNGKDYLRDVSKDWGRLFKGKARFVSFTHQDWVAHVRATTDRPGWANEWLEYVSDRYSL